VVVAHDLDTLPIAAAVARLSGARLLYDSHELYVEHESEPRRARSTRRVQRMVEARLIRRADVVITVNVSIAEELERRYSIPRPTVVMNVPAAAPANAPTIDLRAEIGVPDSMPIAVYVGGLGPGRGLEQLIASAAHLPDVALVVLGPGAPHYRAQLAALAGAAGASERVFMLTAVTGAEVSRWVAGADVGVVPYRSTCLNNYLALPNKLFEYLSAGLPVVTSDFPELRRIVLEHGVGATFDPEDPADIARAVRIVLPPASGSTEMRAAARAAGRLFTWEREREHLLSAFEQLGAAA
jgi:glycosyltransferase involved in cell wall biosynthesis